jgi:DNA polymerase III subunit gamma/tau
MAEIPLDAAAVRRAWPALLEAAREQSRATQVMLGNATATAVHDGTLILALPTAPMARRLSDERNSTIIRRSLQAVLDVDWQIRCVAADKGESL